MKGKAKPIWQLGIMVAVVSVLCLVSLAMGNADAAGPLTRQPSDKTLLHLDRELLEPGQHSPTFPSASAASATLSAVTDAEVMQGYPNAGCGGELMMRVGYDNYLEPDGQIVRGLVKFNLASIPEGAAIGEAQLRLFLIASWDYPGASQKVTTYRLASPWAEDIVNWHNAPTIGEAYGYADVRHDDASHGVWYSFDVTQLVRDWHNGTHTNYGIALRGPEHGGSDSAWKAFASSETISPPQLVVNYASSAASDTAVLAASSISPAFDSFERAALAEDFGLSVSPHTLAVEQGQVATYTLSLTATELFTDQVMLDMTSVPSGAVGIFSSNPVSPPVTVTMAVSTADLTPTQYTLLISGTSEGITHTAAVTLTVEQDLRRFLPLVTRQYASDIDHGVVFLFIGIADYMNMAPPAINLRAGEPGWDLYFTVSDSTDVGDTFSVRGCAGVLASQIFGTQATTGCSLENMLALNDSQATKAAIEDAILNWLDPRETQNTTVIIHFSGHGGYGEDMPPLDEADGYDEYLAPYDLACDPCGSTPETTNWLIETGIRDEELATWLDELESQQIVLSIDSCFSGGMIEPGVGSARALSPLRADSRNALLAGDGLLADVATPGRIVLTASTAEQGSWEFGELKNGVFTHFMVEGLQSTAADANSNGQVSAEEAFAYLAGLVDSYVLSQTGYHQNPQIYDGVAGEVNLIQPFAVATCP